ncbi:MAG: tetratricopeptide repeat protein [Candidatus Poribacteria bacterium]
MKRFEHPKRLLQITRLTAQTVNLLGIYFFALSLLLCTYLICNFVGANAEERKYLDVDEVLTKLEQAVVENPKSVEAHLALGKTYLAISAMDKAEAMFLYVIGLEPKFFEGYYWLGRVYYLQEKFEESRNTFQTAAELFPDWGETYAELGLSYFRLHQYEEAEKAFLKALSLNKVKRRNEIMAGVSLPPLPLNEDEKREWIANVTPLSEADIYYYLSLTFFKRGLLDEASEYCERAILIEPFAEAYFQLGLVSVRKKKLKKAEEAFRQALNQKPTMAQAHYQLALLYSKQKRITEAKKEMEIFQKLHRETEQFQKQREALVRSVDKAAAFANLGLLYLDEQKYAEAAREYQKAIWHNPDFAEAYNGLGHAYALLGRFDEAIQAQQKAIELQPNMAEAYAGLGFTRMKQAELSDNEEDYKSALEAYRKATELRPDFPEALQNLGNLALKLSMLSEAEKAFETLLSLALQKKGGKSPQPPLIKGEQTPKLAIERSEGINLARVYMALGTVYLRQRDFPKAVSHYQQALKYDPNAVNAYYNMGFIATKVGRLDKAIEFYKEVLKRQPDMSEAHYLLGKIYEERKRYEHAEKEYKRAIELEPTAAYAYERLAHLYGLTLTPALSQRERGQKLDQALRFAKKAVELQPDSAAYLNTLSWLYYLRQDYARAEQAIQKALSLQPDNPVYQEGRQIIQQARRGKNGEMKRDE